MFRLRVEPHKMTNYYTWSNEIEVVLQGKGIWKYVDPKGKESTSAEDKAGTQKSDLTLAHILKSIERSCKFSVIRLCDQCKVWKRLKETHEAVATAAI